MTSVLRQTATNTSLLYPAGVVTLTYGNDIPVPFTYDKKTGTLDFDFGTGFAVDTSIFNNTTIYVRGSSFAAIHNVTNIGPNIVAWLENDGADAGSVSVHELPIVSRANILAIGKEPNTDQAFFESSVPWNFSDAAGNNSTNYYATYLFRKPLVMTYTKSAVRYYRLFNTQFSPQT